MAVTVTINKREAVGRARYRSGTIDFDASYPTGGESLSAADLGLGSVDLCLLAPASGLMFEYDHTNSKVKALYPTGGAAAPATRVAPVAAAPTASGANAVVPAGATAVTSTAAQPTLTITQPTITAPALTAGIGLEVGNTTDLSAVTGVRFVVWGT